MISHVAGGGGEASVISIASNSVYGGYAGSVYESTKAGQWYADDVAISGETGQPYTMTLANEGKRIRQANSNVIEKWVPTDAVVPPTSIMDIRRGISYGTPPAIADWDSQVSGIDATAASQPQYNATAADGAPRATFDGGDVLNSWGITSRPVSRTYIGLVKSSTSASARGLVTPNVASGYGLRRNASGGLEFYSNATVMATSGVALADNVLAIVSAAVRSVSGGAYAFRIAGADAGSGTISTTFGGTASTCRLGTSWLGVISSHVTVDELIDLAEIQRHEAWLAWSLGKAALLPADHPYKAAPPDFVSYLATALETLPSQYVPIPVDINHILAYGQSLSIGATATALTTTQPYSNIMFSAGIKASKTGSTGGNPGTASLVALIEDNLTADGGTTRGETGWATMANEIVARGDCCYLSGVVRRHGGYKIADLNWSSPWIRVWKDHLTEGKARAVDLSKSYAVSMMPWIQGETDVDDGTGYATYTPPR